MKPPLIPSWLSPELARRIDVAELALDDPDTRREVALLEVETGHRIAAYRAGAAPRENALCTFVAPAELRATDLDRIGEAERRVPGVVFVAYARPTA